MRHADFRTLAARADSTLNHGATQVPKKPADVRRSMSRPHNCLTIG